MFWWKFDIPSWREMSESPPAREAHPEPNGPKFGWQHRANMFLEEKFRIPLGRCHSLSKHCGGHRGPLALAALFALPTSHPDRTWLCRFAFPSLSLSATADVDTDVAIIEQFARFSVGVWPSKCVSTNVTNVFIHQPSVSVAIDTPRHGDSFLLEVPSTHEVMRDARFL